MSGTEQRRRRALRAAAPVAGLLAAGLLVWQGSYAAFSATTDNTNNAWSTGKLALANNGGVAGSFTGSTAGVFAETLIKPGSGNAKCITVESTGTLPASLRLWRGALTGTNAANLAAALTVTVDAQVGTASTNVAANCTGYSGGVTGLVYNGTLSGMPTAFTGATGTSLAGGTERVVYRIGWSLPTSVTDNTLQSSSATTTLTWEAQ